MRTLESENLGPIRKIACPNLDAENRQQLLEAYQTKNNGGRDTKLGSHNPVKSIEQKAEHDAEPHLEEGKADQIDSLHKTAIKWLSPAQILWS